MKIQITLRDTDKIYSDFVLRYRLRECSLTRDWLSVFVENFIKHDHPIEKTFCLFGWLSNFDSTSGRSIGYLCKKLNQDIDIINKDLNAKGYEFIDLKFDVESLKDDTKSRDILNQLHHHFELLIGQVWSPSKWFELAEETTRSSIRNLNNICHELEHDIKCIKNNFPPRINVSLNGKDFQGNHFSDKQRKEISLENYKDFLAQSNWGTINIYYAQLGKTFKEAYDDKDEYIGDDNISGHRYLTGEFVLSFYDPKLLSQDFVNWLTEKGLDYKDPTLAINHPIVGHLETSLDKQSLFAELRRRDDLYKIELLDDGNNLLHEKIYDFTWRDQES